MNFDRNADIDRMIRGGPAACYAAFLVARIVRQSGEETGVPFSSLQVLRGIEHDAAQAVIHSRTTGTVPMGELIANAREVLADNGIEMTNAQVMLGRHSVAEMFRSVSNRRGNVLPKSDWALFELVGSLKSGGVK